MDMWFAGGLGQVLFRAVEQMADGVYAHTLVAQGHSCLPNGRFFRI